MLKVSTLGERDRCSGAVCKRETRGITGIPQFQPDKQKSASIVVFSFIMSLLEMHALDEEDKDLHCISDILVNLRMLAHSNEPYLGIYLFSPPHLKSYSKKDHRQRKQEIAGEES